MFLHQSIQNVFSHPGSSVDFAAESNVVICEEIRKAQDLARALGHTLDVRRAAYHVLQQVPDFSVLILRRSDKHSRPGQWDIPGGKVDGAPTCLDESLRERHKEVREKAGLRFIPSRFYQGLWHSPRFIDAANKGADQFPEQGVARFLLDSQLIARQQEYRITKNGDRVLYFAEVYHSYIEPNPPVKISSEHDKFQWVHPSHREGIHWASPLFAHMAELANRLSPEFHSDLTGHNLGLVARILENWCYLKHDFV